MNPFALFSSAFVVGLSGAMAPGPVLTATIAESLRRGFVAGPLIVLGHAILELALLALVVGGLGTFLELPAVAAALGLVGGSVLVWMGVQTVRTARSAVAQGLAAQGTAAPAAAGLHPVAAGILLSLSNPYWILWWATIGLTFAGQAMAHGLPGLASFYAGHISADLAWYSAVSAAVAGGRRIVPPSAWRVMIVVCGVALCAIGVRFLADGVGRLAGG